MSPTSSSSELDVANAHLSCKWKWCLIKVDEGIANGQAPNDKFKFVIIPADDLLDFDFRHIYLYIYPIVNFRIGQNIYHGKMVMSTSNRRLAEDVRKHLIVVSKTAPPRNDDTKYFVVQYEKNNRLVHTLMHERDICWKMGVFEDPGDVLIRDGYQLLPALVLHAYELSERDMVC